MLPRDCEDIDPLVPGDVWKDETQRFPNYPCLTNLVLVAEIAGRKRLGSSRRKTSDNRLSGSLASTGNEGPLPRKLCRINRKGRGCVAHAMVSIYIFPYRRSIRLPGKSPETFAVTRVTSPCDSEHITSNFEWYF